MEFFYKEIETGTDLDFWWGELKERLQITKLGAEERSRMQFIFFTGLLEAFNHMPKKNASAEEHDRYINAVGKGIDSYLESYNKAKNEQGELGATGEYPDGKLNDNDEGALKLAVTNNEGLVFFGFGKQIQSFAMPPQLAINFAETIIKNARDAAKDSNDVVKVTIN